MNKLTINPRFRLSMVLGSGALCMLAAITVLSLAETSQDKPDLNVGVSSFYPREIVRKPSNITVTFSRDLVPDDSVDILFSDPPLEFKPPLPGLAKWVDNNKLRYFPDAPFLPSTEYSVRVLSDKTYLHGNRINESGIFRFRTAPFAINNITTEIINIPDPPFESRILIHLYFNYPVDPAEVLENFTTTLSENGRSLNFSADKPDPTQAVTLTSEPFNQKEIHGKFSLTLRKGLNCIGGSIPLAYDFKREFHVPKPRPLVVNHVRSFGAGKNCVVEITLSQSVALSEIKDYITISPEIDFTADQRYRLISLRGDFKPRETYTINIKKGLRSLNGEMLERDFSSKIHIGDLPPSIRFMDDGVFMSKKGRKLLEIETINVSEITVEVQQVFVNNIVYYLNDGRRGYRGTDISRVGRRIFHKDYLLAGSLNEPLNTTIDLGSIAGDSLQGIYDVSIGIKDRRWKSAQRRVMITDLGIIARKSDDYLMVWINSLSNTDPIKGAEVKLISLNNQILAEGKTNSDGVAVLENFKEKGQGLEPFLITVEKGGDLSYLRFNECLISTAEFDIRGRPYMTNGYEAFIYSDRGVYRPGEIAHLVAAVRGKNGEVPPEFPFILQVKDPRGKEFAVFKLSTKERGISSINLDLPSFAQTGAYVACAKIGDNVIGSYSFQAEEFMPDRIKTTVSMDKSYYNAGDTALIEVNGNYLFGPPCDGNSVNGHVTIEKTFFKPKEWSAFNFTNNDLEFPPMESDLPDDRLDDSGNHQYKYIIPLGLKPPSMLGMLVSATIKEDGGRAVSDYRELRINPYPYYIGIKKEFESFVRPGEAAKFSIIAVDHHANPVSGDSIRVKLFRTIYQTIVQKDPYGNYRYVSELQDQLLDSVLVLTKPKPAPAEFVINEYGAYKILIDSKKTDHTATASFYVSGWGYSPWSLTNPDRIEMEMDKDSYNTGEDARILIKAPFDGKLLLAVEEEKILTYRTYTLDSNTAEIVLPISSNYAPNVYLTATLIKSTTSLERFSPSRAFGMVPLRVENSKNKLDISVDAPAISKPQRNITINLNSNAGKGARFTIAAVDVGILQLTDFAIPDPFEFFHGKRSPALKPYDIYSIIFPDIEASESRLSPSGGAYFAERKRHLNPITARRVKPVALWSGLLETDENGNATVSLEIPQFNGKLSVAAVVIDGKRCASTSKEIIIRDQIVVQENLPRFLSPGDRLDANYTVFNNTGKSDSIGFELIIDDAQGNISKQQKSIFLETEKRGKISFDFAAPDKPGKLKFEITGTNGDEVSGETIELPNRPPQPLLTEHGSGFVEDGSPVNLVMPDKWLEGTDEYYLRLSSLPALRFANSIQYLLRYPYGCIEQTTSKIMPLIYFNDLAKIAEPEIFGTRGHEYFIQEGISKISGMQQPSGAFQYWSYGGPYYPWASVYASHALVEARKAGYWISDDVYDKMIGFLQRQVRDASLQQGKEPLRIYAAYVLALAGKLEKSSINNLKKLDVFRLPLYSRFQLAGAIALTMGGDQALWLMPVEIHPLKYEPETGGLFDSDIRANAILIETLIEINPDHPSLPVLVNEIAERLYVGKWYTTQSNGFALMALGKYFREQENADYTGTIIIDGQKFANFAVNDTSFKIPTKPNKEIEISINGAGKCYYYWQASGVNKEKYIKEFDNRLAVRREYLDSQGQPLSLEHVPLGEQIVVKITAETLDRSLENVAINDLLPACLEIENPRLKTTAKLDWIPRKDFEIDYTDIRDDRLLLFLGLTKGRKLEYYYSARVIAAGDFTIPPVAAECMYDPTIASSASSGTIKIVD